MDEANLDLASPLGQAPAPVAEPGAPESGKELIPEHQLLRRIGRGSYGEIWLVRNRMGLYRAAKIVRRSSFSDQTPFEREWAGIRKFEPVSRSHEGFVDVLQVGISEIQGYFYYVMELADDERGEGEVEPETYSPKTLAKEIKSRGRLPAQDCLALSMALSLALAELHKRGLVHRDVKPSNIVFVHGVPKLADIGLVTDAGEARSYVGTEGFIPPEGPGTPQADVFGLGKVLYECSTGKDRQEFPDLPTQWDNTPDQELVTELNAVVLKACKTDPAERYRSAWEMHSHLVLLANGKSVRRLTALERKLANLKRLGISVGVLALILLPVISLVVRESQRNQEQRQQQVGADVAYGNRAMEAGDLLGALPRYANVMRMDDARATRQADHRLRFGATLVQCPKLVQVLWTGKGIAEARFGPDNRELFCAQDFGKAQFYNLATGEQRGRDLGTEQSLSGGVWSPDGKQVLTANQAGTAVLWDAATLQELKRFAHPQRVYRAKFSPDGKYVATGCQDRRLRIWSVETAQVVASLAGHTQAVVAMAFSPDGRLVAAGSMDQTARLWSVDDGQAVGPVLVHPSWVVWVHFSPDGRKLLTACMDHKARVWQTGTNRRLLPDLPHNDAVASAEFSPDGRLIVTACWDGTARLWDADTLQPWSAAPALKQGHRVNYACFDATGQLVLTGGVDGSVLVWDLAGTAPNPTLVNSSLSLDGQRTVEITHDCFHVREVGIQSAGFPTVAAGFALQNAKLTTDGAFVMGVSRPIVAHNETNRLVQVWSADTGKPAGPALRIPDESARMLLSRDGRWLLTWSGTNAQVWEVSKGRRSFRPLGHTRKIESACLSSDGERFATASGTEVRIWNVADGSLRLGPLKHPMPVRYLVFSPNNRRLVACCCDDSLDPAAAHIWDAHAGQLAGPPLQHRDGVIFAVFSPDGNRIATTSEDFTAAVWDVASGQPIAPSLPHQHQVWCAAFSPDGRWVVTASVDRTVRVWSATTGDPLTPPLRHRAWARSVQFFADGRRLFSTDGFETSWVWNLPVEGMPADDAVKLASLLSGGRSLSGKGGPTSSVTIRQTWLELRERYPACFATSRHQVEAWEELQAAGSETAEQWAAASFHLKQLLAIRPQDRALLERLSRVEQRRASAVPQN